MTDARLVVAFTAGMLATVNPCALPMLPAYLGWFISGDEEQRSSAAVPRAVAVALAVSGGFVAVFGALGALATAASAQVEKVTPWLTPVIGLVLAGVGLSLAAGRSVRLPLPGLDRVSGERRGMGAMVLYGASYAVVSVTCTLGIFLVHVSTTFGRSWATGLTQLAAFAVGFSLVLVALSVSVALARGSIAAVARRASAYVGRISGVLLVVTGVYLVWYGVAEIRLDGGPRADPVIDRVTGWSGDISARVQSAGGVEVGLVLALFVSVVALAVVLRANRSPRPH